MSQLEEQAASLHEEALKIIDELRLQELSLPIGEMKVVGSVAFQARIQGIHLTKTSR